MSVAIRSPSRSYRSRRPHWTVVRHIAPVAIFVEIFSTRHLRRNVVRRLRVVFPFVALECEVVEIVAIRDLVDFMIQLITAREASLLSSNYSVRGSAASGFPAAVPDCGIGFISVCAHIDAIFAGALNLKRKIGRIDFELILVIEMPYAHDDGTLG